MNRRQFFWSPTAALLSHTGRAATSKPNVLFIMPDQLRGMDLGCAGNAQLSTPHLDALARDGVRFTGAVSNTPICTPARGTLLTGKYAHETGTAANDLPLPTDVATIAKALSERGYYTGFVGKWHLAGGKRFPGFVPPGPKRAGFQYWAANICNHSYLHQDYFRDDPKPIPMKGYDAITWTDLGLEFLDKASAKGSPLLSL